MKKYGPYILVVLAFLLGLLLMWFFSSNKINQLSEVKKQNKILKEKHYADSIRSKKKVDSLFIAISGLENTIKDKDTQLADVKYKYIIKKQEIEKLSATKAVAYFALRTGDAKVVKLEEDTMALVPMKSITVANILFVEGDQMAEEKDILMAKIDNMESLIDTYKCLDEERKLAIKNLNDNYNECQQIVDKNVEIIKDYQKKVRKKNILMGVIGGVAVAGVTTILILK